MYPSTVRVNHRYRGPVESFKQNMTLLGVHGDLTRLMRAMDEMETELADLHVQLSDGQTFDTPEIIHRGAEVFEVEGVLGRAQINQHLDNITRELSAKGGVLHG